MADISKIKLLNGVTYDIKDETAREQIANLNSGGANVDMTALIKTKLVEVTPTGGIAGNTTFTLNQNVTPDTGYKIIGVATFNCPNNANICMSSINVSTTGTLIVRGKNTSGSTISETNAKIQIRLLEIYTG